MNSIKISVFALTASLCLIEGCKKKDENPLIPVGFSVSSLTLMEGTSQTITVKLGNVLTTPQTFNIQVGGNAEFGADKDYTTTPLPTSPGEYNVTIPANTSEFTFEMDAVMDTLTELTDSVTFSLNTITAGITPGTKASLTVRIVDTSLSSGFDTAIKHIEEGGSSITVKIKLGYNPQTEQSFKIAITGTAEYGADKDYTLTPAPTSSSEFIIVVPANTSEFLFQVTALQDLNVEPKDSIIFTLTDVSPGLTPTARASSIIYIHDTPAGLVAEYLFDGNAFDTSGKGHNGTIFGAVSTNGKSGAANTALYFDGSSDYVQIGNNSDINFQTNQEFSVSLWVSASATQNDVAGQLNNIIRQWVGDAQGYPFTIVYENETNPTYPHHFAAARYDGSACYDVPTAMSSGAYDASFHHIVFEKSGSQLLLYVDNALTSSISDLTSCQTSNISDLFIGCEGGTVLRCFTGKIDDLRIYNRALTADEINTLFTF